MEAKPGIMKVSFYGFKRTTKGSSFYALENNWNNEELHTAGIATN
jgi:hypothetical protein